MPDRSLRGMSIGAKSMESELGVDFAPRFQAYYDCPADHTIILPFSTEAQAEVPLYWECRCGEQARLRDGDHSNEGPAKPQRTHWDMLIERRSPEELRELLDERLEMLQSGKIRRG